MYDVFISFKNLDADGNRTEDSFIAERLYELFKEQGLNVFYSNKVLNELGAASYKKEIEEALENSSVLVSVATKKEFLESQWVAYERESFHNDILSGRKVKACIVPFLKGITGLDVPRSLRNYQTFQIGISSNGEVVDFVKKFLKSEDKKESFNYHKEEISLITGKHLSSYKAKNKSELKRLRIQAINTREPDQNAIKYVLDHMPKKEQLSILDMGCAYGFVTKDRFAKIPNAKVIGVDRGEILIDYAKENSMFNGASYYVLDLEDEEVIDNLYEIMQKENIEKFDIIFASLVIHHLKNPNKLLRNIRKVLADDGYIIIRGSDDGSIVTYNDDGLIQKVVDLHLSCDGISDRLNGRKIYSQLVSSGYKNVKMINWVKEVSGMDLDERNEIFIERFSYRKNYIKTQCEKDPYNAANRKKLEEMEYLLSELENKFSEESFWYSEIDFVGVAQKK
ncbi:MAG: methyltransferase domain-containing protein [Bacilli bacterium]|nr:methyltransferase domain-containing protein [Bacilli bacterium]